MMTQRGNEILSVGGFDCILKKNRKGKLGERTWRCRENKMLRCPGSMRTLNRQILENQGKPHHSHHADPVTLEAIHVQPEIRAASDHNSKTLILAENLGGLSQDESRFTATFA